VLWNGGVDDTGHTRGLGAGAVAAQPPRTILCETIHRFKGLERDVVVLVELRPDDERLRQLLYIGITRARHHVALVVVPEVAARLQRGAS
jgi:superfamily I DNA/RNA helicase